MKFTHRPFYFKLTFFFPISIISLIFPAVIIKTIHVISLNIFIPQSSITVHPITF